MHTCMTQFVARMSGVSFVLHVQALHIWTTSTHCFTGSLFCVV
jgi:hypothetical protein